MKDESTGRSAAGRPPKIPESVLVVIHTPDLQILLLERADRPGYWQSVTGSKDSPDEPLEATCQREVFEETGLTVSDYRFWPLGVTNRYEIYAHWRHRYASGVTHNVETAFALQLPAPMPVRVAVGEHLRYQWLPWQQAAARCFSPTNASAIALLADSAERA